MDKAELIITALQQRIGEMAAAFELEKAMLRAEYTELKNAYDELDKQTIKAKQDYSENLANKTKK